MTAAARRAHATWMANLWWLGLIVAMLVTLTWLLIAFLRRERSKFIFVTPGDQA